MKTQHKYRNLLTLLLSAVLLLTGCVSDSSQTRTIESTVMQEDNSRENPVNSAGEWTGMGGSYKLIDAGLDRYSMQVFSDGDTIFSTRTNFGEEAVTTELLSGNDVVYKASYIYCAAIGSNGIWLVTDTTDYSANSGRTYALVSLGADYSNPVEKDITQYLNDNNPLSVLIGDDGIIYILISESILLFDAETGYLKEIKIDQTENTNNASSFFDASSKKLVLGGNGKVYLLSDDRATVSTIDAAAETVTVYQEHPGYRISNGNEDYLFTLVNEEGLYGVAHNSMKTETIAIWSECSIAIDNASLVWPLSAGDFLLADREGFYRLIPVKPSEIKFKTQLTMASVASYTSLTQMVSDFNLHNDEYTIRMVDYSGGDTRNIQDAVTALNMDIIAGNYPDLIDLTGLTESYYSEKGLLADLYAFMDKDPDISRDDFVLLDKLEEDGSLYYAGNSFYIETAAGLWSRFGDNIGWSLDEFLELQNQYNGEIIYNLTKEIFLRRLVYRYAAEAIDWKEGTCDFESEAFLKILTATGNLRENPEPENNWELDFTPGAKRVREGTLITSSVFVTNVKALAEEEAAAEEKLSFVGAPTPDGSSGTTLGVSNLAGMCTGGNTDGAWEFIKYMLTADMDEMFGISPRKEILERQLNKAMGLMPAEQENENQPETSNTNSKLIMTREDADRFYDLLESSVYYGTASDEIVNIVLEEAAAFLTGDKSAEETARIIQSRISILVAEWK